MLEAPFFRSLVAEPLAEHPQSAAANSSAVIGDDRAAAEAMLQLREQLALDAD